LCVRRRRDAHESHVDALTVCRARAARRSSRGGEPKGGRAREACGRSASARAPACVCGQRPSAATPALASSFRAQPSSECASHNRPSSAANGSGMRLAINSCEAGRVTEGCGRGTGRRRPRQRTCRIAPTRGRGGGGSGVASCFSLSLGAVPDSSVGRGRRMPLHLTVRHPARCTSRQGLGLGDARAPR
jgi:hypothetical protein